MPPTRPAGHTCPLGHCPVPQHVMVPTAQTQTHPAANCPRALPTDLDAPKALSIPPTHVVPILHISPAALHTLFLNLSPYAGGGWGGGVLLGGRGGGGACAHYHKHTSMGYLCMGVKPTQHSLDEARCRMGQEAWQSGQNTKLHMDQWTNPSHHRDHYLPKPGGGVAYKERARPPPPPRDQATLATVVFPFSSTACH